MFRRPLIAATLILALTALPAIPAATAAGVSFDPIAHMTDGPHAAVQTHRAVRSERSARQHARACRLARRAGTPRPRLRNLGCKATARPPAGPARQARRAGPSPARALAHRVVPPAQLPILTGASRQDSRSISIAWPMPPATHIDSIP